MAQDGNAKMAELIDAFHYQVGKEIGATAAAMHGKVDQIILTGGIDLSVGTVATITASSLILGLVDGMGSGELSLVVLAVGAGSLFFSHVNDAGFWLVKEYFTLSVGQTIKTWSIMETVLSVSGLAMVLILDVFV